MEKRPHSPGAGAGALVKRQRTEEGSLVKGSITKEVSVARRSCVLGGAQHAIEITGSVFSSCVSHATRRYSRKGMSLARALI